MKTITKLIAAAVAGAAVFEIVEGVRRYRARKAAEDMPGDLDERFDTGDLDEPVVIAEEVVVITDAPFAEP